MTNKILTVVKHNDLINACYELTTNEQRIILFTISKLNSKKINNKEFIINIDEFADFYELDAERSKSNPLDNAFKSVKLGIKNLFNRVIKFKSALEYGEFRWIQEQAYFIDESRAKIVFSDKVMPYLEQLDKHFTTYKLTNAKDLINADNKYSIRFYELLVQYLPIGKRVFSTDELREILALTDKKAYSQFKHFKNLVIKPCINEINEKTDISVDYKTTRVGRKVQFIEFTIKKTEQLDLFRDNPNIKNIVKDLTNQCKVNRSL